GRKALRVIDNVEKIIGIELLYAAQAMDYHAPLQSGKIMTAIYNHVRSKIEPVVQDRILYEDMEEAIQLIQSGELLKLAYSTASQEGLEFDTQWSYLFTF
ncbi:MAG TPA: histidine ammonia-lyase, partial [Algoriphagus sp.]